MLIQSSRSSRTGSPEGYAPGPRERNDPIGTASSSQVRCARHLRYLSSAVEITGYPGETALAEIRFGAAPAPAVPGPLPRANIVMAQPDAVGGVEMWTSRLPVQYGEVNHIQYAADGEWLFGVISEAATIESDDFEARVQKIYRDIFALTEMRGYPHLLRMWNYVPGINRHYDGLENYQRFCRGRAQAFQARYGNFNFLLPSASGVGIGQGSFVVYFIAAHKAGVHRENPRQVSAYSYPPQYGKRSPSFARATLSRLDDGECFFISGTASIVGHQSLHVGHVRAQLDETLRNVEILIESTAADERTRFRSLTDIDHLKVYLRCASDMEIARELIQRRIGSGAKVLYLVADICRQELLVEVEAVIGVGSR